MPFFTCSVCGDVDIVSIEPGVDIRTIPPYVCSACLDVQIDGDEDKLQPGDRVRLMQSLPGQNLNAGDKGTVYRRFAGKLCVQFDLLPESSLISVNIDGVLVDVVDLCKKID